MSFAIVFHDIDAAASGAEDVLHWLASDIPVTIAGKADSVGRFHH